MSSVSKTVPVTVNKYDVHALEEGLEVYGYDLEYLQETTSTMDDAKKFGLSRTLVLADHQTAGRGRYKRSWLDVPGQSVLMTFAEPWGEPGDPPNESLLPQQLFVSAACLALRELTASADIQIRWPNDLTALTRKLGGILIENTARTRFGRHAKLFGIGINVHEEAEAAFPGTDYGAISVNEAVTGKDISRQDIVVAIARKWASFRVDLASMNQSIFNSHNSLWREQASLLGYTVQIDGLGKERNRTVQGKVMDTPLGGGIVLDTEAGTEEIVEFHTQSIVRVIG